MLAATAHASALVPASAQLRTFVPDAVRARFPLPSLIGARGLPHMPAPPADYSPVHKAELAVLHRLQTNRTPEGVAWARRMEKDGALAMWLREARAIDAARGGVGSFKALALVQAAVGVGFLASQREKMHFARRRPFQFDPTLVPCVGLPRDKSYPSGHATSAFAAATVLARLNPEKVAHYADLAAQVAYSRVYGGVHHPSDVVAGATLGAAVATKLLDALGIDGG